MTDEPAPAAPAEPVPSLDRARVEPSRTRNKWDLLPILYLVGFLVLAGTVFFLWRHPPPARLSPQEAGRVDTLQSQLASVREDLTRLQEQKPPPAPAGADLATLQQEQSKLQEQVNALQNRPATAPAALQPLEQQVQALAAKQTDLQPLAQRVQALEQRPQVDPAALDKQFAQLSAQLKQVGDQVQQLASRSQDATGKLGQSLDQLQRRVDGLEQQQKQTVDQVNATAQKAQLATRLQGAAAALAAGQKLGDIPGAPPALARFANEAPPTEASLRSSFDRYAAAAEKASQPAIMDNQGFGSRLWTRAQQLLTIRQGDRVLLGDPIAGVMAQARDKLDNGDLAGAVEALKGLAGPAAAAMKPWLDNAHALLDARAAIASMAAG